MLAADGLLSDDAAADASSQHEVTGVIATIAQAVVEGNSHFYVTLEDDAAGTIYDFALPEMVEIVTYQAGDKIAFRCGEKIEGLATVTVTELL